MLGFLHEILVPEGGSGHAEYATLVLACVALVNVGTCIAVRQGVAQRVFEAAAGSGVALACLLTLLVRGTYFPRQVIATLLMVLWGARMSWHLYRREGVAPAKTLNVGVRVLWSMLCALPVIICNARQADRYETTRAEGCAVCFAFLSIVCEYLADAEKQEWHAAHAQGGRPGRGDVRPPVCDRGWWAYSRHPNLFFELCFHWGIYVIVRPVEEPLVVLCPLALTLLITCFPGGVLSQDVQRQALYGLYPSYARYRDSTPALVPLPPLRRALEAASPQLAALLCLECVGDSSDIKTLPLIL